MVIHLVRQIGLSAAGTYAAYLLYGLLHPSLFRAGATRNEMHQPLPGDDLVPHPLGQATRATTVRAPTAGIWPWLVQMGYGRAGWYSWYALDNGGVPSADRIIPELQHLQVGDVVPDGPMYREGYGIWKVAALEPYRALVLYSARHPLSGQEVDPREPRPGVYVETSWAFTLVALDERATRLLVRVRGCYAPRWLAAFVRFLLLPADTVMERTMLLGIKRRAEAMAERRR